ncbi:alpha/beta fold hydrolase [Sinimarinibacterium sp. CAU 1509]|uniref:alpha/beta fold hydrolase n=1 Tax=Sinimarinibacterium sp. CAU 1509 TaxID=2562283 RepID=UPI00146F3697|nr:alpha/beta fold hydrolase [Sinimarinibacterium sp. CAU 1509]
MPIIIRCLLPLLAAGLSACGAGHHASSVVADAGTVAAQAYDISVDSPAPDNLSGAATTAIAATVFVPAHRAGERYPLILHSHGWGGDRINASDAETNNQNADTSTLYSRVVDLEVKRFWDAGYAVISFDERGIGQSGGMVRVMDPDYETRDAMALIDWALANLDLALDAHGDPRVGTIGGSYGGGCQLLLAARWPRAGFPACAWSPRPTSAGWTPSCRAPARKQPTCPRPASAKTCWFPDPASRNTSASTAWPPSNAATTTRPTPTKCRRWTRCSCRACATPWSASTTPGTATAS